MCGGCGKRFERKAALHSHAQMCIKRIAVCNSIKEKENSAKRKEEETKDKNKVNKTETNEVIKGASKRKPYLLRTYKKPSDIVDIKTEEEKTSDICDVNANNKLVKINCDISSKLVTDNLGIIHEANHPKREEGDEEEAKSPETVMNTSDNLENFRGFSRECEVELRRVKSEDNDGNIISPVFWSRFEEICDLQDSVKDTAEVISSKSNGKITLRSLEDLTGISPINKKKKLFLSQRDPLQSGFESTYTISDDEHISDSIKANISPKMLRNKSRPSKRKRASSYDLSAIKRMQKQDSLTKEEDIDFVEKASPFMDKKNLLCKPCNKAYPSFAQLLWHMSGHFSWFKFQCSRCSFISFSKLDCAKHAKDIHGINRKDIQGVVLPIPNWKIALMSHEFSEFNEENDLTGKHTDEVIVECDEENDNVEDENKSTNNSDDEEVKMMGTLFVDTEGNEELSSDMACFPLPMRNHSSHIKDEISDIDEKERRDDVIDIIEDTNDSFLLEEIPQEIYSTDNFEIVTDLRDDVESTQFSVESHDSSEDLFQKFFIPRCKDIEIVIMDNIKEEMPDSLEDDVISSHDNCNTQIELNGTDEDKLLMSGQVVPIVNTRPTRNRMRSIKTRQDDFLYEFDKGIKLNESSNNKTVCAQKLKKSPGPVIPKTKSLSPKSTKIL